MWHYIIQTLQRHPGKSALTSSGFLLAGCILVLLSATTNTVALQGNQIISQNWRAAYDLVVLPTTVPISSGKKIPPDYLQSYHGGISVQQYNAIKSISGVEVAAPIAYIGYASLPSPTIYLPHQYFPAGYYQFLWKLTAFNGHQQIVEQQLNEIYYIYPCPSVGQYGLVPVDFILQGGYPPTSSCDAPVTSPPLMHFSTPDTGTFLLAAIDPEAESRLLHLDQSITQGRLLTAQDKLHGDVRASGIQFDNPNTNKPMPVQAIPLIINQHLPGQIDLRLHLSQLAQGQIPVDDLKQRGGVAYLMHLPHPQTLLDASVPLVQNDPQRFAGASLAWDGHTWYSLPSPPKGDLDYFRRYLIRFSTGFESSALTYQATNAPDGSGGYALVPTSVQGPEVGFRPLLPLQTIHRDFEDVVYSYETVGQFTDAKISAQYSNPLNWLPENTYNVPPVTLRYDAQGRRISPTLLLPTTNRAGFITQPPLALTTLLAAQQLKGNHLISAVRVRVSGVNAADETSWRHIERIAGEIAQQTRLQVVVTLGSSPHPTLVYVPGLKPGEFGTKQSIAPLGWVEERWIEIGIGLRFLQQLGVMRFLLLGAVLGICLGYLQVSFSAMANAERREFAILSALGWRPWQPAFLFLIQALLLALLGGASGLLLALLLATLLEVIPLWPVVFATLPIILGMALLSALVPFWQLWHMQSAEILRMSAAHVQQERVRRRWRGAGISSLESFVLYNLTRARTRTFITGSSLFLSAALLVLMLTSILSLRQQLSGTLLGDFVLVQTAIPQLTGCLAAVALAFLSIMDLLLLQVRERHSEIGLLQAVGWRLSQVQRLFVQEGMVLALLGTLPGTLAAQELLLLLHQASQQWLVELIVSLSVIVFMLAVAAVATLPALSALRRLPVGRVLRAE